MEPSLSTRPPRRRPSPPIWPSIPPFAEVDSVLSVARIWLSSLFHRRRGAVIATAASIAITVALLATLFGFFAETEATMTKQAVANVSVDWQVQLTPGANPQAAIDE